MKAACPRLFEAEALRDGRLGGAEEARFRAHLETCSACAAETRELSALAHALRQGDSAGADELHVRRERTRLLAAFDASLKPAPARRRGLPWALAAAVLALGSGFFFAALRSESNAPSTALPTPPTSAVVRAVSGAAWSRQVEAELETITIERGVLSIRVEHDAARPRRRLLVRLPDGELEDLGTIFTVSVDAGQTTRVHVEEGSVVLRLRGKLAITLGAGDSWSPAPASSVSPASVPAPPSAVTPTATAPPARSGTPESDDAAITDFRAAMAALGGGDPRRAADLFGEFLARYPRDSRAEDAAYLRVLAQQRAGNDAAMRQAAADYLLRYPRGFRRAEVEAQVP